MKPMILLDTAALPDGGELRLFRRDEEFSIRANNYELMNSRAHGSEEALASIALQRLGKRASPRVLVGGLGMGFTAAAVLNELGPDGEVVVAEIVPKVVTWNRDHLAHLAGRPLDDPRTTVVEKDVVDVIRGGSGAFDAILLDVDNGPAGLTVSANDRLYSERGLRVAHRALRSHGIFALWSSADDAAFTRRLTQAGFESETVRVRGRGAAGGHRYLIWIAKKV